MFTLDAAQCWRVSCFCCGCRSTCSGERKEQWWATGSGVIDPTDKSLFKWKSEVVLLIIKKKKEKQNNRWKLSKTLHKSLKDLYSVKRNCFVLICISFLNHSSVCASSPRFSPPLHHLINSCRLRTKHSRITHLDNSSQIWPRIWKWIDQSCRDHNNSYFHQVLGSCSCKEKKIFQPGDEKWRCKWSCWKKLVISLCSNPLQIILHWPSSVSLETKCHLMSVANQGGTDATFTQVTSISSSLQLKN